MGFKSRNGELRQMQLCSVYAAGAPKPLIKDANSETTPQPVSTRINSRKRIDPEQPLEASTVSV
jgi:hypothetical protein